MTVLFLSCSDILTKAQRVSHTWKNTITQSLTIQRCLELRPDIDRVVSPLDFLRTHMRNPPQEAMLETPDLPVYPHNTGLNRCIRDGVLEHVWKMYGSDSGHSSHTIILSMRSCAQTSRSDFRPTWLGSFLTVPRITVAYLELKLFDPQNEERNVFRHHFWSCASVYDPEGLNFETVLQVEEKIRQSAPMDTKGRENASVLVRFVCEPRAGQCPLALNAARKAKERDRGRWDVNAVEQHEPSSREHCRV
jgi:hypothetical protein